MGGTPDASTIVLPPGASFDVVIAPGGTACAITATDCLNRYKNYDKWLMTPVTGAGMGDGYWHPTFNNPPDCGPVECLSTADSLKVMALLFAMVAVGEIGGAILDELLVGVGAVGSVGVRSVTREAVDAAAAGETDVAANGVAEVAFGPAPSNVLTTLERVQAKGSPLPGYKGGTAFENDGRLGSQVLPRTTSGGDPIAYREWDIYPNVKGVDRGPERIVTGSDGSAYYTGDHYVSFIQFPAGG